MNLIQKLVEKGILDKVQALALDYEVKNSGKSEEKVILEKGIISEETLYRLKSEILKIPFKKVSPDEISLETLELIPEDSAKFYSIIPLRKKGNILEIGMVYPENLRAKEAIKFLARQKGFSFKLFLLTPSNFKEILKKYRTAKEEVATALEELEAELKVEKRPVKPPATEELTKLAEEAPISKVVGVILRYAIDSHASDIHIEPLRDKLRIRFRLLGILYSSFFLPLSIHPAIVARIKILSELRIDETRIPQDGRFSIKTEGKQIDFRVSTFPTVFGEKVVLRVLDPSMGLKSFEELGLSGRAFEVMKSTIKKPYGMILVTGPTGSGKTTTLYAVLRNLNKEGVNIVTLEDPVEYYLEGINQSQIKPEIGYTFAQGLRHILRQDPDIIFVGEIRDEETASLAIHAALTGHLVLSTLHATTAAGVIPRLIDLGIKPYLLPPALSIALSQRLVRTLCPFCKKKTKPMKKIEEMILKEIEKLPEKIKTQIKIPSPFYIYQPVGCKKCNHTGYSGRTGVFEVLEMTKELAEIILKEPSEAKILEEGKKQGMITMKQDGILKVIQGITTIEEVERVTEQ